MSDIPWVVEFKGKRADDMTREELLELVEYLAGEVRVLGLVPWTTKAVGWGESPKVG